jgi:Zn-dependent protease with chaperone function
MSSTPTEAFRLPAISPKAYEHPADRAATAALGTVPYLDQVVRKLTSMGYERALRANMLGSSVRLGDDQLPRVWALHHQAFRVLDVEPLPALYLTQFPMANAATIGADAPVVLINSEAVQLLDDDGLRSVLGHEAGHVLSAHVMYRTALEILMGIGGAVPLMGLPLAAVRMALGEWFRASELSCDRAAALVTRDPEAVCRALMVLAAGVPAAELNLGAFLRQADEYETGATGLEWLSRRSLELRGTHPLAVRRSKELMDWVRSGEYDRIVGGEYLRRGEEPAPRKAAADAADHYADRFKDAFADVTEQLEHAGKQVGDWLSTSSDWLRRTAGGSSGDASGPDAEPGPEDDVPGDEAFSDA